MWREFEGMRYLARGRIKKCSGARQKCNSRRARLREKVRMHGRAKRSGAGAGAGVERRKARGEENRRLVGHSSPWRRVWWREV